MLAAFCTSAYTFELRDVPVPEVGEEDILVRVRRCGICGSDLHFFHGGFPPPPVCPGHEISGEVTATGSAVRNVRSGDRVAIEPLVVCGKCVFCRTGDYQLCRQLRIGGTMVDGGFAEYVVMPASAAFPLPDAVDFEVGALAEPLAVAVHGVRLANVRIGDRVLVLGGGTIGLLAVAAARAGGAAEVWITARYPQQEAAARALGASRVFHGPAAATELAAAADDAPIDAVLETVGGNADTVNEAVLLVRPGGTISVLGVFTITPALNALLLMVREIRLVGSMTYGRVGPRADFDIALQLLAADPERFRTLITHRVPLVEISRGFAVAADKKAGSIKVAVEP
jgi:2-desacetyl-2-hydroxyethyl bacteriochlorophyllide A dehydrogenase